uniref:Uncharacterized protein n=1 Tax=Chromera velia CCMP2878 TaxID=1169474 RepID=A0A0G4FXA0_9ALVE|eukprot:Cvel_19240.t1-p1 / transcript=Cvel_19240.t1 / gene=Cvel_19240 / organism=Chromera_velia_CCMP2878 / gene_product=hypothetical protein / transcript_product=hypothetical protein / location=Cvel_scaffold1645:22335-22793(-) / protein_length=153 / sequence_SO=supercontig / SO=protein_coding / is_pseudo=false
MPLSSRKSSFQFLPVTSGTLLARSSLKTSIAQRVLNRPHCGPYKTSSTLFISSTSSLGGFCLTVVPSPALGSFRPPKTPYSSSEELLSLLEPGPLASNVDKLAPETYPSLFVDATIDGSSSSVSIFFAIGPSGSTPPTSFPSPDAPLAAGGPP